MINMIRIKRIIGLGFCLVILLASNIFAAKDIILASPDGLIQLKLFTDKGRLSISVNYVSRPVLETSPLVIVVDKVDLSYDPKQGKIENFSLNEPIPLRGNKSLGVNHCNGLRIPYTQKKSSVKYTLEIRAYNNGIALRFIIPGDDLKSRLVDEFTTFNIPEACKVWYEGIEDHYEGVYSAKDVSEIHVGEWAAVPMTFRTNTFKYISITEAALVNYSGMALKCDGQRGFSIRLAHSQPLSSQYKLHYGEDDGSKLLIAAGIKGTITTPWRLIMMGDDLNGLVNADLVQMLAAKPDSILFPLGFKTSWIKPGRASWKLLDGGGDNTIKSHKKFIESASKLGLEYDVLESYWIKWNEKDLKDIIKYAGQLHVGLWVWKSAKELKEVQARKSFFKRCHDLGFAGIKVDYLDNEAKAIIDLYYDILREAAVNNLLICFHGCNKPTGESRSWPNELSRAAVKGLDDVKISDRAKHDVIIPFTRLLAGEMDYQPLLFNDKRGNTSWAHQLASIAVFNSSLMTFSANPSNILSNPCLDMIKTIPTSWDETKVLEDSEIGDLAIFARRSGKTWFLAILNGPKSRTIKVPLSFLEMQDYKSVLIGDDMKNSADYKIENTVLKRSNTIEIELRDGGGFLGRFSLNAK
jgi:alpha-glucosidase